MYLKFEEEIHDALRTVKTSYVQPAAQAKVLCGPVQVFAVVKVSYLLTTFSYFDNLEFDIFDAGGLLSATLSCL